MDDVKAARERLSGVWTVGYVEDNCRERLANDVHTLLDDHARLSELWENQKGTICQGPACPVHHELDVSREQLEDVKARLSAEVERLATPGLPEPQDVEVKEAVEFWKRQYLGSPEEDRHMATLLRAVQSPRLTGERLEAAQKLLAWLDVVAEEATPNSPLRAVGIGAKSHALWFRAAFPELADGN